jgi:hypothetical protein
MKLYKYRSTSKYSLEGLINNELFFSSYEDFNDPFEFENPAPDLTQAYKNARKKYRELFDNKEITRKVFLQLVDLAKRPSEEVLQERKQTLDNIKKNILNIGILCLSEIDNNILMWSHYAEEHRGFCIEFDQLDANISVVSDTIKVQYLEEFEDLNNPDLMVDFFMIMFWDYRDWPRPKWEKKYIELSEALVKHEESQSAVAIMGNKYIDWSYEKEVRLTTKVKGPLKYDPKSVISITFGLRMSESDKSTIMNICKANDKCHIRFKQAEKVKSGYGIKNINLKNN